MCVVPAFAGESYFDSGGTTIRIVDEGHGTPVVLIHGIYGNIERSWKDRGVFDGLLDAGYRVIALDNRGHGKSEKPHDPAEYGLQMPEDVGRLLDHLDIDRAHIVGYSMGGRIATKFRALYPNRTITLTVGGNRLPYNPTPTTIETMDQRLRERGYERELDSRALAAMTTRYYEWIVEDSILQSNETPTLIMVGADDRYAGRNYTEGARVLANTVAGADFVIVSGDHRGAARSPEFLTNMLAFLAENNPGSTQN